MRGLYAIVDVTTLTAHGLDPVRFAEAVLVAKPAALQLRAKHIGAREVLGLLRALAPLCHHAKVPLVANDRADLAMLAGCDIVHVGQDDIGIDLARRLAPSLGVGVSTHDAAQLATALAARPTYAAFGPVFATSAKTNPAPIVGVERLREAYRAATAAGVPLVAIGGISLERVPEVATVCDAVAVITGLVPSRRGDLAEVTARAEEFQRALTLARGPDRVEP